MSTGDNPEPTVYCKLCDTDAMLFHEASALHLARVEEYRIEGKWGQEAIPIHTETAKALDDPAGSDTLRKIPATSKKSNKQGFN